MESSPPLHVLIRVLVALTVLSPLLFGRHWLRRWGKELHKAVGVNITFSGLEGNDGKVPTARISKDIPAWEDNHELWKHFLIWRSHHSQPDQWREEVTAADARRYKLCSADIPIPNPFSAKALHVLFDHDGLLAQNRLMNFDYFKREWMVPAEEVFYFSLNCTQRTAFARLIKDGLSVNTLGMDFTEVQRNRHGFAPGRGDALLVDRDVEIVRKVFMDTVIHRFSWEVDFPVLYGWHMAEPMLSMSEEHRELIMALRRDGFVQIEHWDQGIAEQVDEINAEIMSGHLRKETYTQNMVDIVKPLLREGSMLRSILHGYLGPNIQYNGVNSLRLPPWISKRRYQNAPWHHDGCGTRLKVFIYAHDVDEKVPVTEIAGGTHRTQWFPTTHFFTGTTDGYNKLNDTTVRNTYGTNIKKMYGPKGGGFVFDTNCLHAADLYKKTRFREVLIMDFASQEHMDSFPRNTFPSTTDRIWSFYGPNVCPQKLRRGGAGPTFHLNGGMVHD